MTGVAVWGLETGADAARLESVLGLGQGAIIGAMLVGAAFLAGVAVLKKSAAATCGLMMLLGAGALQAIWLGVIPEPPSNVVLLIFGLFAAAVLIFLSATIAAINRNQLFGGLVFAGALSMVGIGLINALLAGEAAGLLKLGLGVVALAAVGISLIAGARGDMAARLILPGAVLAASAPMLLGVAGASGPFVLAPQALFAIGVLTASLVALGDFAPSRAPHFSAPLAGAHFSAHDVDATRDRHFKADALRVSENQLAEVLDYAGVAVWDWSIRGSHQSQSFATLMGADSDGGFTPEILRDFIHSDDVARIESALLSPIAGDGTFDETARLHNGAKVRLRGARAVNSGGEIDRLIVFAELADGRKAPDATPVSGNDSLKAAAVSLTGALANTQLVMQGSQPAAVAPEAPPVADDPKPETAILGALDRNELAAAFQPIVSFESGRVCGAEALLRWPNGALADGKAPSTEEVVRLAQQAGKGGALASLMLSATADYVAEKLADGESDFFGAFNVSLSQVRESGFVDEVKKAIADRKLPKGALVLELTEGEKLGDLPRVNETFKKLRAAGASLAYDDFGAGFSSLSNLHRYDFDFLKIDKSFIDDIVANGGKKKIVAALARLGRDFDMTVIAEGVESKEAAEVAKSIGCRMGQGYFLGEPAFPNAVVTIEQAEPATVAAAHDAAESGEIVLDRSMEAPSRSGRLFRRRLSSSRR